MMRIQKSLGFTLVEVLVALLVTGVGLLGLAKLESLAISSSGVAAQRSLAAIQASSLASMMHANRDFWASSAGAVTVAQPIVVNASNNYSSYAACTLAAPCTPANMAYYDLEQWATSMNALLPGYSASINCALQAATVVISCTIQISWVENVVANNAAQSTIAVAAPTYTLYVDP